MAYIQKYNQKKWLPGYVHPIGGKVDVDEDPYRAAQRELLEEAGITVSNMRLEAVVNEIKPTINKQENRLIFHFSGDYNGQKILACEEGEFIRLTKEEILQRKLFVSVSGIIKEILDPQI